MFGYYIFDIQFKEGVINNLLFSMTHVGQEARILAKYFNPEHRNILAIQENIDSFRSYIKNKKLEREKSKQFVERLIEKEEELDNTFIDEISKELDKDINNDINDIKDKRI